MKFKLLLLSLLTLASTLFFTPRLTAQCDYSLQMQSEFSDGWYGGVLTITSGTQSFTFSLNNITDNGEDSTVFFSVADNEPLVLTWTSGFFDQVVSFRLINYDGDQVNYTLSPEAGVVYTGVGECPSCIKPANFRVENVFDNRIKFRWNPLGTTVPQGWWVIYGQPGFTPSVGVGDTLYVTQPKATVGSLTEMLTYDFYLRQDCGAGDVSDLVGPIRVKTYWSDDVSIHQVLSPVSSCALSSDETVNIIMKNNGANPQSLVPFYYSVNGIAAAIPFPEDGLYTGVLGKDSCEVIEFDTKHDFSAPGEYVIRVWTEMMGDDNTSNDTLIYRVVNRLPIPYVQGFEIWSGAWSVDTVNSNNSTWELGQPDNTIINAAASGSNAWVTNLNGQHGDNEKSYLLSPCFDFSAETTDPVIEFSINYDTQEFGDGAYLELSIDGGTTWAKVGAIGEGVNWYNNTSFNPFGDNWGGLSDGWIRTHHGLTGSKGKSAVKIRFVFESDQGFGFNPEGVGIDDIRIFKQQPKDLYGYSVKTAGDNSECGLQNDEVTFRIINLGSQTQTVFKAAYSINGGTPIVENITGQSLVTDEFLDYTFNTTFDSRDMLIEVKCWALLTGDQMLSNDTTTLYVINHLARPVPLLENFEGEVVPEGWVVNFNTSVTDQHNNNSFVLANNLFSFNTEFIHDIPRHGVIDAGDTLIFDYRIADYTGGQGTVATNLVGTQNKVSVQISTDCGDTYTTIYTINATTHVTFLGMKRIKLNLSAFAGQSIKIRFKGEWDEGDFYVDFDNINIRACGENMGLRADITNTGIGQTTGKAKVFVDFGNPPYTYIWSTGATTQTALNLMIGTYIVSVTDSKGCMDTLQVSIGNSPVVNIEGLNSIKLHPNPTTGLTTLALSFDNNVDATIQVLNLLGQVVETIVADNSNEIIAPLDFTAYPDGLFLVRISVGTQTKVEKLIKSN
jgi:Secretion system C-terminal sorting domain